MVSAILAARHRTFVLVVTSLFILFVFPMHSKFLLLLLLLLHKPQSASKIRLVRWQALLETRASRLPTTRYAGQPIAIGSQAACRLHAPPVSSLLFCTGQRCGCGERGALRSVGITQSSELVGRASVSGDWSITVTYEGLNHS